MTPSQEPTRPSGVDVPPSRVEDAYELLRDLDRIRAGSDGLMRGVEAATGLRAGEIQVLEAVGAGADHVRAVARRTGQPTAAARATISGLAQRDLLERRRHRAAPEWAERAMLAVTETGRAVLGQAEALRLRLTDALLDAVGPGVAANLSESIRALTTVLAPSTVGPGRRLDALPQLPSAS